LLFSVFRVHACPSTWGLTQQDIQIAKGGELVYFFFELNWWCT
jgi:hypothetical protein